MPLRKRGHRYVGLVVTFLAERHYAVDQRKERVVLADADIVARVVHRTALADEDVARFGNLTAEEFYSQSLSDSRPFLELPTPFLCAISLRF